MFASGATISSGSTAPGAGVSALSVPAAAVIA